MPLARCGICAVLIAGCSSSPSGNGTTDGGHVDAGSGADARDAPITDSMLPVSGAQQISVFNGPLNPASPDYAQFTTILAAPSSHTYLTGVTTTLPLGCNGTCTGEDATYLDHPAAGIDGSSCPGLTFTGSDSIDALLETIATAHYANNLIISGAGYVNNNNTPAYLASQEWADNLDTDCATRDPSLTWQPNHAYIPGDYIVQNGVYWQMTSSCVNGDDVRCTSGAMMPSCLMVAGTTCADNTAVWTETPNGGAHAPPLDFWCDENTTGLEQFDCFQLKLSGAASITNHVASITVASASSYPVGQAVVVTGASDAAYNCASGCTVTMSSGTAIQYKGLAATTGAAETLNAGTISGAHALNIHTASLDILEHQLPIPYEQPMRLWREYVFGQIAAHYATSGNPQLGYVRLGLTKSGETDTSNSNQWPFGLHAQPQMLTYESEIYTFMGAHGCGTTFSCVGNLHTYPAQEAAYMNANNIGFDNNALGVDQFAALVTAGACVTVPNGGNWCGNFKTYDAPLAKGGMPVFTLQTGGITQFSSPGMCGTGDVGAMSADPGCTTTPFTGGYPGNLRSRASTSRTTSRCTSAT